MAKGQLVTKLSIGKIYPDSDLLGTLAVCDEYQAEVLEFVKIRRGITIK